MENLDVKQTSCQDGLSQGWFKLTTKIISSDYKIEPYILRFLTQRFQS